MIKWWLAASIYAKDGMQLFLKFNQNSRFNSSELSDELDSMRSLIRDELRITMSYDGLIFRGSTGDLPLIMEDRIEGTKGRGRPRRSWIDGIFDWTNKMNIRTLKRAAKDSENRGKRLPTL